jgi:hypothetical protein
VKRLGRSALPLPRYTLRKRLGGGRFGYFFNIPMWARKRGCSIANEALGTDYKREVTRAEQILLPAFDSWRTGGEDANPIGIGVVVGTLDWSFTSIVKPGPRKQRSDFSL